MRRNDCIVDCVGPDCEGCRKYKTAESMKTSEPKPTKEEIKQKIASDNGFDNWYHLLTCADESFIESCVDEYAEAFHKEKLRGELILYDEYLDEYVDHKRSKLRVETYLKYLK